MLETAIHFGVSLRPSYTTWPALREWGRKVEALGYESFWAGQPVVKSGTLRMAS